MLVCSVTAARCLSDDRRVRADFQQAVIEKYRHCDDSISKLLDWVERMERRVANQERIQEDVSSLRNQINVVRVRRNTAAGVHKHAHWQTA